MFKVLLSHDPTHWRRKVLPETDVQLMLAGTHMICKSVCLVFLCHVMSIRNIAVCIWKESVVFMLTSV